MSGSCAPRIHCPTETSYAPSVLSFLHVQVKPDYLFISTWNEAISQPQANVRSDGTFIVPPGKSMGLESDATGFNRSFVGASLAQFTAYCKPYTFPQISLPSNSMGLETDTTALNRSFVSSSWGAPITFSTKSVDVAHLRGRG